MELVVAATPDSATPHRTVRSIVILVGGIAGVVLGLTILTALARPAGAATLPSLSPVYSAVSVPAVSVPAVSVPAVSVPSVSVPAVSVPAVSVPGTQSLPTVASLVQVGTATATGVPGSAGSLPATIPTTTGSLAAPVIAAGRIAASSITVGSGDPIIPLVGASAIGANGPGQLPTPAVSAGQAWPGPDAGLAGIPLYSIAALAPTPGSAKPSPSPTPTAPHPAPPPPYPATNSFLAVNDMSGDSGAAQGGSPFGTLPPVNLLLPALALGGVLLLRGTRPRLLLDSRCSPPG